jgi:hypothetical protein
MTARVTNQQASPYGPLGPGLLDISRQIPEEGRDYGPEDINEIEAKVKELWEEHMKKREGG